MTMTDDTRTVDNTEEWRTIAIDDQRIPETEHNGAFKMCLLCKDEARYPMPRIARPWRWPLFEWLRRIHAGPWRWVRGKRGANRLCLDHYEEAQDRVDCKLQQLRCTQAQHILEAGNNVRKFNRTGLLGSMGEPGDP